MKVWMVYEVSPDYDFDDGAQGPFATAEYVINRHPKYSQLQWTKVTSEISDDFYRSHERVCGAVDVYYTLDEVEVEGL